MLPEEDRRLLTNTLAAVNVDPETIAEIESMLKDQADTMAEKQVMRVRETAFGGSHAGGHRLATNASLAHEAVVDEMQKMVAGLRKYAEDIAKLAEDAVETDAAAKARIQSITTATECVTAPTFDAGQCTIPTDSTGS